MKKYFTMLFALIMSLSLAIAVVSCGATVAVTDFSVDYTEVVKEVEVGDDIDVSKVKVTVTYDDGSVKEYTAADVEFYLGENKLSGTVFKGLTENAGKITITVKYLEQSKTIEITVSEKQEEHVYDFRALSFETPADEVERINAATDTSDEEEGKFFASNETIRLVGDDNAFVYIPTLTVIDANENAEGDHEIRELSEYDTQSEIYFIDGENLVKLDATEDENAKTISYKYSDVLIVTSYYDKGEYKFSENAVGNEYQIKIIAREYQQKSATIDVKVVDGYNVYDAKDLGIIDNSRTKSWSNQNDWAAIREEKGWTIEMIDATNAVVLQRDIKVTYADLPAEYVGEIAREMVYYNFGDYNNPVETGISNYRLAHDYDYQMSIYERDTNKDFAIYGNFYSLNLSEFPLASAFDEVAVEVDEFGNHKSISKYGSDYSNATLIRMKNGEEKGGARVNLVISNLDVIGNANIEQYQVFAASDTDKRDPLPVNAGGLIFLKASYNCDVTVDNSIVKTTFIAFLPEYDSSLTVNNVKVFDCYQNAGFVWDECTMTVTNSVMKRAGGPLFIMQHVDPETNTSSRIPELYITDTVLENFVTGEELWFSSMGATTQVAQIKEAVNLFAGAFGKTVTKNSGNKENCLNLIVVSMSNGTSADDLQFPYAQGYCTITQGQATCILDRMNSHLFGGALKSALNLGAPTFNVNDGGFYYFDEGLNSHYQQITASQDVTNYAIVTSQYIVFNKGGLGLTLEMFPAAA